MVIYGISNDSMPSYAILCLITPLRSKARKSRRRRRKLLQHLLAQCHSLDTTEALSEEHSCFAFASWIQLETFTGRGNCDAIEIA